MEILSYNLFHSKIQSSWDTCQKEIQTRRLQDAKGLHWKGSRFQRNKKRSNHTWHNNLMHKPCKCTQCHSHNWTKSNCHHKHRHHLCHHVSVQNRYSYPPHLLCNLFDQVCCHPCPAPSNSGKKFLQNSFNFWFPWQLDWQSLSWVYRTTTCRVDRWTPKVVLRLFVRWKYCMIYMYNKRPVTSKIHQAPELGASSNGPETWL